MVVCSRNHIHTHRQIYTHAHRVTGGEFLGDCKWELMFGVENESVLQKSIQSKQKSEPIDCGGVWCLLTHPSSRFPYKWKAFNSLLSPSIRTQGKICILVWGSASNIWNKYRWWRHKISLVFCYISCNLYWLSYKHVYDLWLATCWGRHEKKKKNS